MATCKECFHHDVCGKQFMRKHLEPKDFELKCRFFKNKVSCKDCKHYQRYGRTSLGGWCMLRAKFDGEHRLLPDDFCSYGERK